MNYHQIDYIFPFVVFAYGAVMVFVLSNGKLTEIAEKNLSPEVWQNFQSKRVLGLICFIVGGLWSLQNIWFS